MTQRDLFRPTPRPWNRGRIVGPKPPFKAKHVWAIRQQLKVAGRVRDLARFDCGIDAKLRGCDLVKLRVSDVAPGGAIRQRATVIQQKTGRPVPFEITDTTRHALSAWLKLRGPREDDWLFPSRTRAGEHMSTRHYARLVQEWVALIDLEPKAYGTHSLRRTEVAMLYKKTGNLRLSAAARSPQAGEHRPLSRYRGRRRSRHVGAGRPLTLQPAAAMVAGSWAPTSGQGKPPFWVGTRLADLANGGGQLCSKWLAREPR